MISNLPYQTKLLYYYPYIDQSCNLNPANWLPEIRASMANKGRIVHKVDYERFPV